MRDPLVANIWGKKAHTVEHQVRWDTLIASVAALLVLSYVLYRLELRPVFEGKSKNTAEGQEVLSK